MVSVCLLVLAPMGNLHDEYRRTFAVFTLAPFLAGSTPPMRNVYIPPSVAWNPISRGEAWAATAVVRWAESGGRRDASFKYLPLDV